MLWQVSTTCLLAVAVLGSLDLVSGKLEALPAGWMEKDPRVKHVQGMAHTTVEEIVKELKQEQASQVGLCNLMPENMHCCANSRSRF